MSIVLRGVPERLPAPFDEATAVALLRYGRPAVSTRYRKPKGRDEVTLYLVEAEVNGLSFQKIGLTTEADPIRRDPAAYKRVIRATSVPAADAHRFEGYALVLCKGRHEQGTRDQYKLLADWDGSGEAVISSDDLSATFDEAVATCFEAGPKAIEQALTDLWHLERAVRWACPISDPKPLPPLVARMRDLLDANDLAKGLEWRAAHFYAVGLYGAVWYRVTQGKGLSYPPPPNPNFASSRPLVDADSVAFVAEQIAAELAVDDPARIAWDAAVAAGRHLEVE